MTDPTNALNSLQAAIGSGSIQLRKCELYAELKVLLDHPNGVPRFTYAVVENGTVQSVSIFALTEAYQGVPCIQVGYAVAERLRGNGLGLKTLQMSIEEFKNGMSRSGVNEFYLEAVVSDANYPSKAIANRLISMSPTACVDQFTNEPALQYLRKFHTDSKDVVK